MKKIYVLILAFFLIFSPLFAQGAYEEANKETVIFVDSSGRSVEIPKDVEKVGSHRQGL